MTFIPKDEILEKYAAVMVRFAPNHCTGVQPGQVVLVQIPECAKPFARFLQKEILACGAHPVIELLADGLLKEFYQFGTDEQISFFPNQLFKGKIEQADVLIRVIAEADKHELDAVDGKRVFARQAAFGPYMKWRTEKEIAGKFSWTLCLYGTQAMADDAKLSIEDYWDEICKACYLYESDPILVWRNTIEELERLRVTLNDLDIQWVRVVAPKTDLKIKLGSDRQWLSGSGCNIPSFEVFISPDWRGASGTIQFTEPLFRYGKLITDASLTFENGVVTASHATQGAQALADMIAVKDANKIGEFSLTDSRHSRITRYMGETLFDENVGGAQGNTHVAIGMAYKDSYRGKSSLVTQDQWEQMGFNDSSIHTDIVATSPRTVIATLADGSERIIYKDGQFTV